MGVWFVTGASRGIGAEIVEQGLAAGHQVVATARSTERITARFPDAGDRLLSLVMDVTNRDEVACAVKSAIEAFETVDVVVNNAGYGLRSTIEEASQQQVRSIYETNVFGMLNVVQEVLPVLRAKRAGHVVNISSALGFTGFVAGLGIFNSTKFAMEGISETLNAEVAPLGIKVTIVEPGAFKTGFVDNFALEAKEITDYSFIADREAGAAIGDPVRAAEAIRAVIEAENPPLRVQLGSDSVYVVEQKLAQVQGELDAWRNLSLSTDHGTAEVVLSEVVSAINNTDITLAA